MTLPALGSVPNALILADVTSPTADQTAKMTLLVAHASAAIRNYTGQAFTLVTDTDQLAAVWGPVLPLPRLPVTNVVSVTADGTTITGWQWDQRVGLRRNAVPVGNVGCTAEDSWPIETQGATGGSAASWGGPGITLAVRYTSGYATTPDDVAAICEGLAASAFSTPTGVRSESLGSYAVTYTIESSGSSVSISITDAKALNRYRKRAL